MDISVFKCNKWLCNLFVKTTEAGIVNEREYEFDKVQDAIFIEPDISQYNIKEQ